MSEPINASIYISRALGIAAQCIRTIVKRREKLATYEQIRRYKSPSQMMTEAEETAAIKCDGEIFEALADEIWHERIKIVVSKPEKESPE